jgi:hypothetical protein
MSGELSEENRATWERLYGHAPGHRSLDQMSARSMNELMNAARTEPRPSIIRGEGERGAVKALEQIAALIDKPLIESMAAPGIAQDALARLAQPAGTAPPVVTAE